MDIQIPRTPTPGSTVTAVSPALRPASLGRHISQTTFWFSHLKTNWKAGQAWRRCCRRAQHAQETAQSSAQHTLSRIGIRSATADFQHLLRLRLCCPRGPTSLPATSRPSGWLHPPVISLHVVERQPHSWAPNSRCPLTTASSNRLFEFWW